MSFCLCLFQVTMQVFDKCMDIWQQLGEILVDEGGTINITAFYAMVGTLYIRPETSLLNFS